NSHRLLELKNGLSATACIDVLNCQTYTYSTTVDVLRVLDPYLLNQLGECLPEIWRYLPDTAGLIATLLDNWSAVWFPRREVQEKLEEICRQLILEGDVRTVGFVEPLAFALGQIGRHEIQLQM